MPLKRPPKAVAAPDPFAQAASGLGLDAVVQRTVSGLHYDLIEIERAARGLLRITIDRLSTHTYAQAGEWVTVEDCEVVTRQLQHVLEVEGVDYARLEVSSPGLDRLLRHEADLLRFCGQSVSITLKQPHQDRKVFKGVLSQAQAPAAVGWGVAFSEGRQLLSLAFTWDEVREVRLVPVINFKGRSQATPEGAQAASGGAVGAQAGQGEQEQ